MVEYTVITETEWEKYPEPKAPKPPNQWDKVLGVVNSGQIVKLTIPEEKLQGTRSGLTRSARTRGFELLYRYENGTLVVRKSETPPPPRVPKERKPRTRKTTAVETE